MKKVMSKDELEKLKKEFARELTKLSKRYDIIIGGCGCCGSPRLSHYDKKGMEGSYEINSGSGAELEWTR